MKYKTNLGAALLGDLKRGRGWGAKSLRERIPAQMHSHPWVEGPDWEATQHSSKAPHLENLEARPHSCPGCISVQLWGNRFPLASVPSQ